MSSSDSELLEAGVSDDDLLEAALVRPVRGPYRLQTQGVPFLAGVVVDSLLPETLPNHNCTKHPADTSGSRFWFVGIVSIVWQLVLENFSGRKSKIVFGCPRRLHAATPPFAWVDYHITDTCMDAATPLTECDLSTKARRRTSLCSIVDGSQSLRTFARRCSGRLKECVVISPQLAACLFGCCFDLAFSVPVLKMCRGWMFSQRPSFSRVRRHVEAKGGPASAAPHAKLSRIHTPDGDVTFLIDPCDYLRFLDVTCLLRSSALLAKAANQMVRALWPNECQRMMLQLLQTGFTFPSKNSLLRARPRLDVTSMLLERFEWSLGMFSSVGGPGLSIHMTADGSPNSGRDFFGVLMDVFLCGTQLHHRMLPGTSLGHGYMSVVDKGMAFLWSIWLIMGPLISSIEAVLCSIRSFTSDFGIESKVPNMANMLEHFARSVQQRVSPTFSKHLYLLPNCVYIPDWNHLVMNLLKRVLNSLPTWPKRLDQLRYLCSLFRNWEYRSCFREELCKMCLFEQANHMMHFTASFAKWRYETVCDVFDALSPLRSFCEDVFNKNLLGAVQDGALLDRAAAACKDKSLWRFIDVFKPLLLEIERFRTWGRGCRCHDAQLVRGIHVNCDRKGRRLKDVPERVKQLTMYVSSKARELTRALCENDHALLLEYQASLRLTQADLCEKFGWTAEPPYVFSNISSPEWAAVWVGMVRSTLLENHNRVTVTLEKRFGNQIEMISKGDLRGITPELLHEEKVWQNMPLCSDRAEGFHRGINFELKRATGSHTPFLFSSMRLQQNLDLCSRVCETDEGRQRFRYNFVNYSQILQTSSQSLTRSKKLGSKRDKFLKIYRLEQYARVDWSCVGKHSVAGDGVATLPLSDNQKMLTDFVVKSCAAGCVYTVPLEGQHDDLCFQVLRVNQKADQKVSTVKKTEPQVSMTIQNFTIQAVVNGGPRVYAFGDPFKVDPSRTSTTGRVVRGMKAWEIGVSDIAGCMQLVDGVNVFTFHSLTDGKVPVLLLAVELLRRGWAFVEDRVTHRPNDTTKRCSVLNCHSKRSYWQCLLHLEQIWQLGLQAMPSNQPQSCFCCLLAGRFVVPALGDSAYREVLKDSHEFALEDASSDATALEDAVLSDVGSEFLEADASLAPFNVDSPSPAGEPPVPGSPNAGDPESDASAELIESSLSFRIEDLPQFIDGARIYFEHNLLEGYSRYILKCSHHPDCQKSRNCMADQCKHYGAWEPIAFLAVWNQLGLSSDAVRHNASVKPTLKQVHDWLADNGKL